jgi:hypothetical protein
MFNPEMNYVLEKFAMQAWMKRDMLGVGTRNGVTELLGV